MPTTTPIARVKLSSQSLLVVPLFWGGGGSAPPLQVLTQLLSRQRQVFPSLPLSLRTTSGEFLLLFGTVGKEGEGNVVLENLQKKEPGDGGE